MLDKSHLLECLPTNAESAETRAHVLPEALCIKGPRVCFHGDLCPCCNAKSLVDCPDQAVQLLREDERWRAPTKVQRPEGQLPDWRTGIDLLNEQADILLRQQLNAA